jgi:lipopolysaccharide export system permease protein
VEAGNTRQNNEKAIIKKILKIIDLYIAKKFLGTIFFILALCAVVSTIFDISEKMDYMLKGDATFGVIVHYYLNFIPNLINLISPMLIFIAALYFTATMANNTEIVALLSSGTSYYRILVPYIMVGLFLVGVDMYMKNFLIPHAYQNVLTFELKYIQESYYVKEGNIHKQLDKNTFFYAQGIDYVNSVANKISIEKFDGQKLIYKLEARDAKMDTAGHKWKIHDYNARTIDGMHETLVHGDSTIIDLPINRNDFGQKVKAAPSLTTPELNKFIEKERFKGDDLVNFYLIEKYRRFSYPFAMLILIMIAVAIATRKVRGGIGAHLLIGILIAVSFELSMRFSTTFSTNANFSPLLAVWIPNIFYGIIAVVLLRRTPK